ncbi:YbjN domain-containing protein [Thermus sp. SYSU G05001]|uniref:YbjN domain-containing protein n=1 Tax=Thermus brevis TaxID=2862456 RepID=A0ABS7A337_9DEIN|nr:YbjN domain-containing protein [Thermus brevis]MBW6396182.1 YbjN domain-containing protein [Thermus brevis]
MRTLLVLLVLGLGLGLGQGLVKGLTPGEVEAFLQATDVSYERREARLFSVTVGGLKAWLELDWCEGERCGLLALSSGFKKQVSLERINEWNRRFRFGRAYLDEDGDAWIETELDVSEGLSWEAVREFVRLFTEKVLPRFAEHIGFKR